MKIGTFTTEYKILYANGKHYRAVRQETVTDCFHVDYLPWDGSCYLHVNQESKFWDFPSMGGGPQAWLLPNWITMA